jgi:hypothetical protein
MGDTNMPVALAKRTYTLTRTPASGGLTNAVPLVGLGHTGNIVKVQVREDLASDRGTAGVLYIADDALADVTIPASDLVYQSGSITLSGSATAASLDADLAIAALPKGEPYVLKDTGTPLNAIVNITAVGGGVSTTVLYLTIWAEVRS